VRAWLTIAEVARAAGVPERTMRRRLHRLAATAPKLLTSFAAPGLAPRKYFVNAVILDRLLRSETPPESEIHLLQMRVEDLEQKLLAMRSAHLKLKRQVARGGHLVAGKTGSTADVGR
jgi:hypothetical protein